MTFAALSGLLIFLLIHSGSCKVLLAEAQTSYLHENGLAELLSVHDLYGHFLTRDAVDADLHQT